MTLLIIYLIATLSISFLCSLMESVLYSTTSSYIESLEDGKGVRLLKSLKYNIENSIAAILSLNTIANTAGASLVGAQAADVLGNDLLGFVSAALTVLVLVFSSAHAEETGKLKPYDEENGYTYITFGKYPQTIDGGSPDDSKNTWAWKKMYRDWEVATRKELKLKVHDPINPYDPGPIDPDPILWRILSADDNQFYVMSEYVLFASPVHPSMTEYRETGSDFGQTQICAKLNGEFADTAFSDAEKDAMLPIASYGKVSLPSADDLNNPAMGFSKKKLAEDFKKQIKNNPVSEIRQVYYAEVQP